MAVQNRQFEQPIIAAVRRGDSLAVEAGEVVSSFGQGEDHDRLPASLTFMQNFFEVRGSTPESGVEPIPRVLEESIVVASYLHDRLAAAAIVRQKARASYLGITALATDPTRRGEGHASRILTSIAALAKWTEHDAVRMTATITRPSANEFLMRRGFEISDEVVDGSDLVLAVKNVQIPRFLKKPDQPGLVERLALARRAPTGSHQLSE